MRTVLPATSDGEDPVQAAVDELAATLGQSVLIEDRQQRPVWWSTRGAVDGTRMRTILNREVTAPAADVVRRFRLRQASGPVRVPALPELDMWPRWCVPIRLDGELLGLLWVLDPDGTVYEQDLAAAVDCADRAAPTLGATRRVRRSNAAQREQHLARLLEGPDEEAASALARLEHLPPNTGVQVDAQSGRGGWQLPGGMRAHLVRHRPRTATSGAPLPLVELAEAVRRARLALRAARAGAELDPVSWDGLGAWRLVVEAPAELTPDQLHPGVATLASLPRNDLLRTARVVLDLGGDVTGSAALLHLHRTTLYYRLDRIRDLTGVDLRDGPARTDLQLALWLAAFREVDVS